MRRSHRACQNHRVNVVLATCYAIPNCSIAEITGGIRAAARIKIPIRKALNVSLIVTSLTMTNNVHAYRSCLCVRLVHIRRKARGYRPPKCLARHADRRRGGHIEKKTR